MTHHRHILLHHHVPYQHHVEHGVDKAQEEDGDGEDCQADPEEPNADALETFAWSGDAHLVPVRRGHTAALGVHQL